MAPVLSEAPRVSVSPLQRAPLVEERHMPATVLMIPPTSSAAPKRTVAAEVTADSPVLVRRAT